MKPAARLFFLAGCVAIAAAASPLCARVVVEDLLGPYAQAQEPRVADARTARVDAERIEVVLEARDVGSTGAIADELEHDAP